MKFRLPAILILLSMFLGCASLQAQNKERLHRSLRGLDSVIPDTMRVIYLDNIGWDTSYDNLSVGLKYCLEGLALAEKINYEQGIIHVCNSIGTIYQDLGDVNKALAFHFRSLKMSEKSDRKFAIANSCMNISLVYISQNDYKTALKFLTRAKNIGESMNDSIALTGIYSNLGSTYLHFPDSIQKATLFFEMALKIATARKNVDESANILGGLSKCYQVAGDTNKADLTMDRALFLFDSLQNYYSLSQLKVSYASMLSMRGHYKRAEALLLESLVIYRRIGMVEQEKELWAGLADIYEKSGQLQKSIDAWKRLSTLKDSLLNENVLRRQRELETVYETEKNELKIISLQKEASLNRTIVISLCAGVLLMILFLTLLYNRSQLRKKTNDQLEIKNAIIEEKNKDITDSINYARRIQDAILPPPGFLKMKFSDAFVFYRPRDIVSGDFWWSAEKDGKFVVACADCTGHGVPGGFMSVMSAAFLSEIVNEKGITEPDMILNHLRRKVISALNKEVENNSSDNSGNSKSEIVKDGMDIVVCTFSDNNEFHFACANNPIWIVRQNKILEFTADKFPVGVHHGDIKPFTLQHSKIEKDDMIYLFSDGFADQFGGDHGKKFKYKQFQDLLLTINPLNGKEQQKQMEIAFDKWKGNLEQVDDVLVIGIRI